MLLPCALLDLITYGGIFTYPPFKHSFIDSQSAVSGEGGGPHDETQIQKELVISNPEY